MTRSGHLVGLMGTPNMRTPATLTSGGTTSRAPAGSRLGDARVTAGGLTCRWSIAIGMTAAALGATRARCGRFYGQW